MSQKTERAALAGILAFGLAAGLAGLRWGLPGPERLRAFPPQLLPSPEVAAEFARRWEALYVDLKASHAEMRREEPVTYVQGVDDIPAGWTGYPPDKLLNSYRSLLLQSENADEKKSFIILAQMRPWKLQFEPLYAVYAGAFIYPLGAFLKALSLVGAVKLVPGVGHYLQHPEDMARLYLAGRVFIVFAQLASLWALFSLGKRLGGVAAGVCAALFFSLCPMIVVSSHFLKPHPYAAAWALGCLLLLVRAFESGAARDYRWCGVLGGVAFASNYTLMFFAGFPLLAWLARGRKKAELISAISACAWAALIFVAANPYFIFAHKDYAWEMRYARNTPGLQLSSLWLLAKNLASTDMGPIFFALSTIGLFWALLSKDKRWRLLAAGFIGVGLAFWVLLSYFAGGFVSVARYYYPFIGWFCLFAAGLVAALPKPARALILCAALADGGLGYAVNLRAMRLDRGARSTRNEAADWIEANVPAGATIGMPLYPEPAHSAAFRYDRYHLVIFDGAASLARHKPLPQYLVYDIASIGSDTDRWAKDRYERVAEFLPPRLFWKTTTVEGSVFADSAFFIYRLKS